MNTTALNHLAGVICRAQEQDRTPMGIAFAIDSAGMHMLPEAAAELVRLRAELTVSEQRSERRRIAWRMARGRAVSTGGAADRYAARARDAQGALQHMLFTVIAGQLALHEANLERLQLRAQVAELEEQRDRRRVRLVALQNDALNMRGSLSPSGEASRVPFELGETLTPAVDWLIARVAELEAEPTTLYRAEHPDSGITLGHYATAGAARKHCESLARREIPGASLDWIEDDEDRVAELLAAFGEDERSTGYLVTGLDLASEYDEEADE